MRKKLLSLALALVMCLGLAAPAMAAYEVKSDKCTYELSNDPVGTTEIECRVLNFETWMYEENPQKFTVYIVPDGTTVTSKTVPGGRIIYELYDLQYSEWGGGHWTNNGEALTVNPMDADGGSYVIYRAYSEDLSDVGDMPSQCDNGNCVMAASAATAAGITAGTAPAPAPAPTPEPTPEPTPTPAPSTGFTDVAASAYYAAPVTWAVEKGITNGTDSAAKKFSPGQKCTNAQILTFLWRAYGQPEPTIGNPFTNTIPEAYTKAAVWAYEKGMVSGTVFDVDTPCTRAMAVTYMWQASGSPAPSFITSFTDVPDDAPYAMAVAWALEMDITTGTNPERTLFSPADICSRGQIVTFLHRNLA